MFVRAAIVFDSETRKDRSVPEGNNSAPERKMFLRACKEHGLPVSAGKSLAVPCRQGYKVDPVDNVHKLVLCTLALLTKAQWTEGDG